MSDFNRPGNRFDLEQAIMAAWGTKEDIELLTKQYLDGPVMSEDDVSNMLIGIAALHDARCQELFKQFEDNIKEVARQKQELLIAASNIALTADTRPYATSTPTNLREIISKEILNMQVGY